MENDDLTGLFNTILKKSIDKHTPEGMAIGKVVSVFPKLEIKVGDLPLYKNNLFINKQLLQHERAMYMPRQKASGNMTYTTVGDHGAHTHHLTDIEIYDGDGRIIFKTLFHEGDLVLLQPLNEEQKYVVICILIDGRDLIENGITL